MKDSTKIFLLSLFTAIWICKPIPYETLAYRIHQRQEAASKVLAVDRAGGQGADSNSLVDNVLDLKNKKKKYDMKFHRHLEEYFPDWRDRMKYESYQFEFYQSGMKKLREAGRRKIASPEKVLSSQEKDAIDSFNGTGFYEKHQRPGVKPNIFDTRKSFLLKMHDPKLRRDFLNSYNKFN